MARYLIIHHVKRIYASQDELVNDWRGLRKRTTDDARWLTSWYAAPSERLYCEWEAASPQAIRSCFLPAELEMAPIEKAEEVVVIDPAWLD
ncbi:MAG TPA: nickel-binding protein [Anaerolineales bacterium]|nr:nickel-binding protein [Anaerolineales bacterium]